MRDRAVVSDTTGCENEVSRYVGPNVETGLHPLLHRAGIVRLGRLSPLCTLHQHDLLGSQQCDPGLTVRQLGFELADGEVFSEHASNVSAAYDRNTVDMD